MHLRVVYEHGDCNSVLHMGLLCGVPPVQWSCVSLALWLYLAVVLETLVMVKFF